MLYLGADHGGYNFKEKTKNLLKKLNVEFEDLGNLKLEPDDDYPDFALTVAKKVVETGGKGILFCTNADGMCITANKIKGIRAVLSATKEAARRSREDLDSNILCLGGHVFSWHRTKKIIKLWLETDFTGRERYIRRLEKIKKIENEN